MYNMILAKIEDHVSGVHRDADVVLALSEIERAGFDRDKIIRDVVMGKRIDSRILAFFDKRLGDLDAALVSRFPSHLRPHVEAVLKAYYLRRKV